MVGKIVVRQILRGRGAPRKLQGFSEDTLLYGAAVSSSGRLVATAFGYGQGEKTLRVWDLETGEAFSPDKGVTITADFRLGDWKDCPRALLHRLTKGTSRQVTGFGECSMWNRGAVALDPCGTVALTGSLDGIVRVGRLSGGTASSRRAPGGGRLHRHLPGSSLRGTTGEDNTLRLWPMPDLSKVPFHTLPRDELLAKLRFLANLRVVADAAADTGYRLEAGPFPGWEKVPVW